jgi:hypothetical protein
VTRDRPSKGRVGPNLCHLALCYWPFSPVRLGGEVGIGCPKGGVTFRTRSLLVGRVVSPGLLLNQKRLEEIHLQTRKGFITCSTSSRFRVFNFRVFGLEDFRVKYLNCSCLIKLLPTRSGSGCPSDGWVSNTPTGTRRQGSDAFLLHVQRHHRKAVALTTPEGLFQANLVP